MLKVVMARPVGDALKTVEGNGNGGKKTITARSPNYHLVHGNISELVGNALTVTEWFQFTSVAGRQLLINARHIAWIEETNEGRQAAQPS